MNFRDPLKDNTHTQRQRERERCLYKSLQYDISEAVMWFLDNNKIKTYNTSFHIFHFCKKKRKKNQNLRK